MVACWHPHHTSSKTIFTGGLQRQEHLGQPAKSPSSMHILCAYAALSFPTVFESLYFWQDVAIMSFCSALEDLDDAEENPENPAWERFLSSEDEQMLISICSPVNFSQFFRIMFVSKWLLHPFRLWDARKLHFQAICPNVSVQPELKPSIIDELQEDLRTLLLKVEMGQCLAFCH